MAKYLSCHAEELWTHDRFRWGEGRYSSMFVSSFTAYFRIDAGLGKVSVCIGGVFFPNHFLDNLYLAELNYLFVSGRLDFINTSHKNGCFRTSKLPYALLHMLAKIESFARCLLLPNIKTIS